MSLFDVLPIIGPSCSRYQLSLLIISQNNLHSEFLSKALYEVHVELENRWNLSIHTSKDVDSVLKSLSKIGPISIDFVIICMDTSEHCCIEWTEDIIKQCNPDLRPGRMVLINGNGLPTLELAVSVDLVYAIKRKYKLTLFNGDLLNKNNLQHIADRLHKLIENTMGLRTGLPNIINFAL